MDSTETISELGLANSSARRLPKDTVIFSRTAVLGLCSKLGREMATSQDYVNFICGASLDPSYMVQLFRHMGPEWERLCAGSSSTNKTIYMPDFERLKILLPPLEEQRAIAAVGEGFDRRIAAETRYLSQLREVKRGLCEALLTGRARLPPNTPEQQPLPLPLSSK